MSWRYCIHHYSR